MSPELVGEVVDEKSKGAIKNIADVAPNFVFDAAAATTSSPVDAMVNPAKVFAQYEGHLRRVAVEIREKRRLPTYKAPQVHDHMVQSLKTLFPAGSELEVLVMAPTDDDDLRNKWDKVYSFLAATMRRAAWTQYCRANWDNASWDYTITVKSTDKFKAQLDAESDPRKWPAKIWDSVQGWPEYWDQICADFIGPEQLPDHPIHEGKPEAELEVIRNARNNQGWISMAAVHCCQIRRWNLSGHRLPVKFDLLHYERDDFSVKLDYAPLAKELVTTTTWDARYKAYLTKKPASCRIVNAFFSTKADKLFSPSGRKGRHDSPASPGQSLMVASGYANSLVVVGIRGSTQLTTNTVTLNIVRLPVTAAEASRVTAESDTGQMYKFYKVSNTTKTLITVLDANKKNVSPPVRTFSTGFKTGVNQTIKFKFEAVGLYCMWLTTTAEDFPVSDALWYVWVVPVPATATK